MPEPRPYSRIRRALHERPWAIHPRYLDLMIEVVEVHSSGERLSEEEIRQRVEAQRRGREISTAPGGIAVLPLHGPISLRMGLMTEVSGGTSVESFTVDFETALRDPNVEAIVIDVDSPGGSVDGIEELGDVVFRARGQKPIVAVANTWAASAAYWIASQADELAVTPSGEVGSIGVIMVHEDYSTFNETMGVRPTYLFAGRYKADGNPDEPLSPEARQYFQSRIDEYYDAFVRAVARGRGVKATAVRGEQFGEGRMVGAASAVAASLADRKATLREEVERLASRGRGRRRARTQVALAEAERSLA
jgi:signal peptide peptidase SppA